MPGARGSGGHARVGKVSKDAHRGLQDTTSDCTPPVGLAGAALAYWHEYAPVQVQRGLLTLSSRNILRDYCELRVEKDRIQQALEESAPLILTTTVDGAGNEHIKATANPLINARLKVQQQLHTLENDLALNPATALRLPQTPEVEEDPLEAWAATGTSGRRIKAIK